MLKDIDGNSKESIHQLFKYSGLHLFFFVLKVTKKK